MNKIFKNEDSFLGKFEAFCWKLWEKEPIRFIFVGGLNTLIGLVLTLLFRYLFDNVFYWNPKVDFLGMDIPNLISFIIGLPIAYTTQTLIAFRIKWAWVRFARYPLSSIPNLILQQGGISLFETILHIQEQISYILATIIALPIMFFIIRFLVRPIKSSKISKSEDHKTDIE